MADEVDGANDRILLLVELTLKQSAYRRPEATATGECLHCGDPVAKDIRWCGAECRDGWQYEHKRGKR